LQLGWGANSDKYPTVPGFAKYQGCPIPDRDGDGINDEEDECPTIPGFARYHGCPIPEIDKDGINDEEDSCVNEPGVREFHGCLLICASYFLDVRAIDAICGFQDGIVIKIIVYV
jgi:hypothetical protein